MSGRFIIVCVPIELAETNLQGIAESCVIVIAGLQAVPFQTASFMGEMPLLTIGHPRAHEWTRSEFAGRFARGLATGLSFKLQAPFFRPRMR